MACFQRCQLSGSLGCRSLRSSTYSMDLLDSFLSIGGFLTYSNMSVSLIYFILFVIPSKVFIYVDLRIISRENY